MQDGARALEGGPRICSVVSCELGHVHFRGNPFAAAVRRAEVIRLLSDTRCNQPTVYEAAGGQRAFLELARAWHKRCLEDPIVGHAFSHAGLNPQHAERLAAYWAEALGGPSTYTDRIADQSHVMRVHSGNGEHQEMDDRAQSCFAQALVDVDLAKDDRLRATLEDYFRWATTEMSTYPHSADDVPANLDLPHWSWNGLHH